MSDDPDRLSLRLCSVLERIGVSDSMRKIYRDTSITSEIMNTITYRMTERNASAYFFGSYCEGTTTPDMRSDLDMVQCLEFLPVIDDIRDAPSGEALLTVTSQYTQAGYVNLQKVHDGTPLTKRNCIITDAHVQYDCKGRVCQKHITVHGENRLVEERHGPADAISIYPDLPHSDHVPAYRSKIFPQIATYSLQKCVACGWMSKDDIERMKKFGVLFVGVGSQTSPDHDVEWRMSFSLQERELMVALNPTQYNCYVLLKTIKDIVTAHPDVGKSLTSYHCKTCLFTVITKTSPALWIEGNLIECTGICLTELENWISSCNCPNFFINENNMFDRPDFRQTRKRLLYYLRGALHEWPRMLYHIESDHIGEALRGLTCRQIDKNRTTQLYEVLCRTCEFACLCQKNCLEYCHRLPSDLHTLSYLYQQLCYLKHIDVITEHTYEQTQSAVCHLQPFIHKLCAQHLASVAFSTEYHAFRQWLLETSTHHLRQGKNCDSMSGKLLEATILYRQGHIEACRRMLEHVEQQIMHEAVVSCCTCYPSRHVRNDCLERKMSSGHTNQQNIMESAVAPCMTFLPSQFEIVPKALQYEMYRSVYASSESRDEHFSKWYDFAVIDCKIYLYFMQYLVYTDLKQPIAQQIVIDQILNKLDFDPNLCHRETAYNLLGWMHTQKGQLQKAGEFFCRSWKIRPDHNAAKWHMPALAMRLNGQQ